MDGEVTAVSQAQPHVVTLAHGGSATEIETFLRQLGYNDQLDLLVWMCQADPDLAARGVGCLIEWRADPRRSRRRERERRQRQRRRERREALANA